MPLVVDPQVHTHISQRLGETAQAQRAVAVDPRLGLLGVPVYAGGDDLLLLAPAATALRLAKAVHAEVPRDLRSASTAVFYFSQHESLQQAVLRARELLDEAKELPRKHGLAVGYQRRTGGGHRTVHEWDTDAGRGMVTVFDQLCDPLTRSGRLSPRLVFDLQRDADALAQLVNGNLPVLRAEIRRLVARHTAGVTNSGSPSLGVTVDEESGGPAISAANVPVATAFADLLVDLGRAEARRRGVSGGFDPVSVARVGVFLRQEAR